MSIDIRQRIISTLPKALLIDLSDMANARAFAAHELVRDHSKLDAKRARELEGQARFRMLEQGFQETCELHGGRLLSTLSVAGSELRIHQPFCRFGTGSGEGVVLGLAAMPSAHEVPHKNVSRSAGVQLNGFLSPQLDLDDLAPKMGDVFGLLLFSRHKGRAGMLEEMAVGVVDSQYVSYLHYRSIEALLSDYVDEEHAVLGGRIGGAADKTPLVRLKAQRKPFTPPEEQSIGESSDKSKDGAA
jgi:hypothetical protein